MNIITLILIALVVFLIFVAWRNNWDWSATVAALAAFGAAVWQLWQGSGG